MSTILKYRLEIAPQLQLFRKEILYAFNYINRHYGMSIDDRASRIIDTAGHLQLSYLHFRAVYLSEF